MLIGVDAGTSVVKAVAFSSDGEALRVAARPTRTLTPAPGRAEQDPEETIAAVAATVREAAAGETPEAVGITAQGDGLWLVDAEGRAVRPAILWSDARAAAIVEEWIAGGVAERAFRRSGNTLFPGAAAPLLAFLRRHESASLRAAATAAYCKDVIAQRLTGVRATDVSDASLPFFDPVLAATIRRCSISSASPMGRICSRRSSPRRPPAPSAEGAALCGVPAGTPIQVGPFDLCATMIGAGVVRPGDGLVIVGTTLGCGVLTDVPTVAGPAAGMLLCMPQADRWVRVMPAMVGTPSLEWIRAMVGIDADGIDAALAASPPGAGASSPASLSPAGERAPFVDPAARGQFIGLSLETTRDDLLRAVCEGIAYAARHCLEAAAIAPDGQVCLSGGGMRSEGWRRILANALQRPLLLARQPEVGARGAAMMALEAIGAAYDRDAWTRPDGVVEPERSLAGLYDAGYAVYRDRLVAARGHWSGPCG